MNNSAFEHQSLTEEQIKKLRHSMAFTGMRMNINM